LSSHLPTFCRKNTSLGGWYSMLHTPWKELIFLATFLKFTCYVYTIRVAPMFCWSPMKKNQTYQSLHSVRSSLWVISSLLNMRFVRFPFCFVRCCYCILYLLLCKATQILNYQKKLVTRSKLSELTASSNFKTGTKLGT